MATDTSRTMGWMGPSRHRVRRNVLAFAPRPGTLRWIQEELTGEPYKVIGVSTIDELVAGLQRRSRLTAIVDFSATSEGDLAAIAALRGASWRGALIALGHVEPELRVSLRVRDMLLRPFGSERLRKVFSDMDLDLPPRFLPPLERASSAEMISDET